MVEGTTSQTKEEGTKVERVLGHATRGYAIALALPGVFDGASIIRRILAHRTKCRQYDHLNSFPPLPATHCLPQAQFN